MDVKRGQTIANRWAAERGTFILGIILETWESANGGQSASVLWENGTIQPLSTEAITATEKVLPLGDTLRKRIARHIRFHEAEATRHRENASFLKGLLG
jgi:hypothetical protein